MGFRFAVQATQLSFSSTFATACTSNEVPISGTQGSQLIAPTQSLSVTVSCTGPGGTGSATARVTVVTAFPPIVYASFFPLFPYVGDLVYLDWSSIDADSCNFGGPSGSIFYGVIQEFDFFMATVTCFGPGGTSSATAFATATPRPEFAASASQPLTNGPAQTFTTELDLDGDANNERLIFEPRLQRLRIEFTDADGRYVTDHVVQGVRDLRQLQRIELQRTREGHRELRVILEHDTSTIH